MPSSHCRRRRNRTAEFRRVRRCRLSWESRGVRTIEQQKSEHPYLLPLLRTQMFSFRLASTTLVEELDVRYRRLFCCRRKTWRWKLNTFGVIVQLTRDETRQFFSASVSAMWTGHNLSRPGVQPVSHVARCKCVAINQSLSTTIFWVVNCLGRISICKVMLVTPYSFHIFIRTLKH